MREKTAAFSGDKKLFIGISCISGDPSQGKKPYYKSSCYPITIVSVLNVGQVNKIFQLIVKPRTILMPEKGL